MRRGFRFEMLEDRSVPAGGWYAVLSGDGARLIDAEGDVSVVARITGDGPTVAVADVTGDRVPDLIIGSGAGVVPRISVFNGATGRESRSFAAFDDSFSGGVRVAAADVTKDGVADFIVAAGPGGGPRVRVLDGRNLGEVAAFFAFESDFRGGVSLAAADLDGDERADVVVGAGPGGGPHVRAFTGSGAELRSFYAYEADFRGGVTVAAADLDSDGFADVITGPGPGGGPRVRTFDGKTSEPVGNFYAVDPASRAGAGVAAVFGPAGADICVGAAGGESGKDFDGRTFDPIAGPGAANGSSVISGPPVTTDDAVQAWQSVLIQALRTEATPPTLASRKLAITSAAVYDGLNSVVGGFSPYLGAVSDAAGADMTAAVSAAAYKSLAVLFPAQEATFAGVYAGQLAGVPEGVAKQKGLAVGEAAAARILASRENDGSTATATFVGGTATGRWRPTPPAFKAALSPTWGQVTPFTTDTISVFAAAPAPAIESVGYAEALGEVEALGSKASATRTPEQTLIAKFWAGTPGPAPSPPGMWAEIALRLSRQRGLGPPANARLFARLGLALADAGITAWAVKMGEGFWRPVTAIREAGTDGNPRTESDPDWEPLLTTPNFPSNPSGHSTFSAAAAEVLAAEFGDHFPFTVSSDELPGTKRSFTDFRAAAAEAGMSRIYGGIHFAFDNTGGLEAGAALGRHVVETQLLPVPVS